MMTEKIKRLLETNEWERKDAQDEVTKCLERIKEYAEKSIDCGGQWEPGRQRGLDEQLYETSARSTRQAEQPRKRENETRVALERGHISRNARMSGRLPGIAARY